MGDLDEAFKLKAAELLKTITEHQSKLTPELTTEVKALFEQAKATYREGHPEDGLILLVQAIQKVRKV